MTVSALERNKTQIKQLVENLKQNQKLRVYAEIASRHREIPVGHIIRARELTRFRLYVREDDVVFYREVPRWLDIYSHKEATISLNISLYHFLIENNVSMIFTYVADDAKMNVSAVASYEQESCLSQSIGWLRRAKFSTTIDFFNSTSIDVNKYSFIKSVVAEVRQHEQKKKAQSESAATDTNTNQRGLFD